uniref:Uncharacterized protein n=1 Tax=Cucumis melo TaxID=3656 RepID=A0A9I9E726_CUCME
MANFMGFITQVRLNDARLHDVANDPQQTVRDSYETILEKICICYGSYEVRYDKERKKLLVKLVEFIVTEAVSEKKDFLPNNVGQTSLDV